MARLRAYLEEAAVLDARALAMGRAAMALLLLYDLAARAGDIGALYSDEGIEPRSEVRAPVLPLFRLYFLGGTPQWTAGLFCLAAMPACALLIGYRTRLATVLSWVMLVALQKRNGSVLQGGDDLLVMFLLWGAFLPLGRCWSVDIWRRPAETSVTYSGPATFAFYGQLFMLYFITGTLKLNAAHWRWGNGIYDALSADYFVTGFGQWLYRHYYVLKGLSWATLLLESLGPLLLFIPPARWKLRTGLVLSFVCFHVGISACMRIGMFSFVCIAGWLFLIPSGLFDHFSNSRAATAYNQAPRRRWERTVVVILFGYLVLAAMVADRWPEGKWRDALLKPARVLALQEHWGMFVKPRADSGFLVAGATLTSGQQVDLLRGGQPLSWRQPALVVDLFANQRWRKMLTGLTNGNKNRAQRYLAWLCRTENARRTVDKAVKVELTYVSHAVGPRYEHGAEERKLLAQHDCAKEKPLGDR